MTKITTNALEEDKLINGGFLAVSLAKVIVISSLNTLLIGWQLFPLILCSAAISPLAFNVFIIKYKKRHKVEIKHWSYTLLVVFGFSLTYPL